MHKTLQIYHLVWFDTKYNTFILIFSFQVQMCHILAGLVFLFLGVEFHWLLQLKTTAKPVKFNAEIMHLKRIETTLKSFLNDRYTSLLEVTDGQV